MQHLNQDLDRLFLEYRDGTAVPEASINFMPQLWARIEGRRSFTLRFKRVTQVFVGSAAVLCLLFVGMMQTSPSPRTLHHATYVDILAEAHPPENLAAQGIAHLDAVEASH